ncbi:MAG: Stk1 family PASTA domain-containing Ser/Thr kinase [Clostridia bacterium]|nr:Stk1 family PASTA domain-containing Ser/Thr kinase [Clostridia bacterium]
MENYVGKRIDGRYEIREVIGVGGMAVVYKAYDNIDDRIVAVKILKEEYLANEEFRRRFKNEPKAIAVLSHPNIVKVYDVSFGDKLQYIVMEYVEGITLKDYIQQQGVLNCKEIVHFTTQILKAIQHAHNKGIVHRDIKPQNILLLQNGTIKVTDFGIARFSRNDTRTMSGNAIGSVHYISPEQARGDVTDEKSDIYSVGVLMYEMLTGQLPFQSDSAVSVALMQVQEEAIPPSAINSDIPTGLEQITMRAMQKNPRDRYQSVAEMLLDIEEYKKDPSIIFDYSYLVEDRHENNEDDLTDTLEDDDYYDNDEDSVNQIEDTSFYDEIDDSVRVGRFSRINFKKYLPVILGIIAAALIIGIVVWVVLDPFGNKKVVAGFVGKNYKTEIESNEDYAGYQFNIVEQVSETAVAGTVISQDPEAGSAYKENMEITLTIVKDTGTVTVPNVYDLTLSEAKLKLDNTGLKYDIVLEYSDSVSEGNVIRTSPARYETVKTGDTVKLFVSDPSAPKGVEIPDIVGSTVEAAKTTLQAIGLEIDEKVEEINNSAPAGTIVSCSPRVGETAPAGTKITVKVSTGNSESPTITVTFTLPNDGKGSIIGKVNSNIVVNKSDYLFDGGSFSAVLTGTGKSDKVTVYVDDVLYYSCNVDFTKSTPVVSGEINNCGTATVSTNSAVASDEGDNGTSVTTPSSGGNNTADADSYVSYYYEYAKSQLEAKGYTVTIADGSYDPTNGNMVEKQVQDGNNITLYKYTF